MITLVLACRMAGRELKGGLKGFRIFVSCLALGVATIAGIGSITEALIAGLADDGRILLGGDAALRLTQRPITTEQGDWLGDRATVSAVVTMRSMAHRPDSKRRTLIYLKAVDGNYPLYGQFLLDSGTVASGLFALRNGAWGAAVEPRILERLGLKLGDTVRVGEAAYQVRARIKSEPDRIGGARAITFGPRFIVSQQSIAATGLSRPGAQISYRYRLRLPKESRLETFLHDLDKAFPDAGWRIRDHTSATPGVQQVIKRTTQFITLVGLTALLIGGIGAGNAVRSYLAGKSSTIATLKCIGATRSLIFQIYLAQISIMAAMGIGTGLLIGLALPSIASKAISQFMSLPLRFDIYSEPLLLAATYGYLIAATFSLWPIARACEIAPGSLFRDLVAPGRAQPSWVVIGVIGFAVMLMGALSIGTAHDRVIAAWFVGASISAFGLFYGAGRVVMMIAAHISTTRKTTIRTSTRLALANLHRPGAQTANIVLSMGLGLTVLVAVVVVEANLTRQIRETLPANAPSYFFIDIQPDQVERFERTVRAIKGVSRIDRVPMLRGRITAVNGVPSKQIKPAPNSAWVLRNDRGLTWSAGPPDSAKIVAGSWWPRDYSGPPLISFDAGAAHGFGIGVGDSLTINVLGRPITARIANLREIVWGTMQINFVIIFSPGVIEKAPQTHIATIQLSPGSESEVETSVALQFSNITGIRVRDILEKLTELTERIADAVRMTAGITVLAGILVLGGAIASGQKRRLYDAVILKVLGAQRRNVLAGLFLEFLFLAVSTTFVATIIGSAAGWAVLTKVMRIEWTPVPGAVTITALGAGVFIIALALAGTWRVLGQKSAPLLRND
ncbi:ABC transporter permease [Alphaproteobacteria bacterium]|nr:ABC transporter permease [Alphaproteobacteria bacterium]